MVKENLDSQEKGESEEIRQQEGRRESLLEGEVWAEDEVANLLGVNRYTIRDLRDNKEFPFIRITSRARVYLESSVLKWLRSHESNSVKG